MQARCSQVARLLIAVAVACCASGAAKLPKLPKAPKPVIYGTYEVECRGYYSGKLTATVAPALVTISGQVTGEDGQKASILATAPMVGYRFTGVAVVSIGTMTLSGRVDPPDDVITRSRLTCNWITAPERTGRMVGVK